MKKRNLQLWLDDTERQALEQSAKDAGFICVSSGKPDVPDFVRWRLGLVTARRTNRAVVASSLSRAPSPDWQSGADAGKEGK